MVAVEHMMKAFLTYQYKCCFDKALLLKEHSRVVHDVIKISQEEATVAVSSLSSIDGLSRNGDYVRVSLNVLPLSRNKSIAAFSYLPVDVALVRAGLNSILASEGFYQKYLLSKFILNNCENFIVSPAYFDRWTPDKKKAVTEYFMKTLFEGSLETEDVHLYLF
jgi:hypothetical protein